MFKKLGATINNLCCTMVAAHLLENEGLSLKALLKRYIKDRDLDIKFFEDYNKQIQYSTLQEMANHFGPHSSADLMLWNVLQRELRSESLWNVFWNVEMPVLPVLSDMELTGALIDTSYLGVLGSSYNDKIVFLNDIMCDMSGTKGVNFNSADQAASILYDKMGVPKPPKEAKEYWTEKRPTVDKSYLEQFKAKFPIISVYLTYKMYRHLRDTYVDGIFKRLVDSRIHTNFNQTRTRTGRLSSTDPNLQNIPMRNEIGRQIRNAFIAPNGCSIVKADMDQVELKKMACLSNCIPMLEAFRSGEDIHKATAIRAYNDPSRRPDGKTLNFKLIYGGGTKEEQDLLFKIYPEVKAWTDKMLDDFGILGYAKTHHGRKRHLGDFDHMSKKEIGHAHREGISTMDQGSCAEYLKVSMRKIWDEIHDTDIKMLLQVHDELVFECPNDELGWFVPFVKEAMRYDGLQIPLTASVMVGRSWGETEKL
jgi:DNA polymerase-1